MRSKYWCIARGEKTALSEVTGGISFSGNIDPFGPQRCPSWAPDHVRYSWRRPLHPPLSAELHAGEYYQPHPNLVQRMNKKNNFFKQLHERYGIAQHLSRLERIFGVQCSRQCCGTVPFCLGSGSGSDSGSYPWILFLWRHSFSPIFYFLGGLKVLRYPSNFLYKKLLDLILKIYC